MSETRERELVETVFDFLCRKYVQRADERQKSMGLQYTEAETHDLARQIATLLERLTSSEVTEEEVLDEFADVLSDEWADRDKSIYRCVERTLERTGYRIVRSAATSKEQHP